MREQKRRIKRLERALNITGPKPVLTLRDLILAIHEGEDIDFHSYANGEQMRALVEKAGRQARIPGKDDKANIDGDGKETKGNQKNLSHRR